MFLVSEFHARIQVQSIAFNSYAYHMRRHLWQAAQRDHPSPLSKGSFFQTLPVLVPCRKKFLPLSLSLRVSSVLTCSTPWQTLLRKGSIPLPKSFYVGLCLYSLFRSRAGRASEAHHSEDKANSISLSPLPPGVPFLPSLSVFIYCDLGDSLSPICIQIGVGASVSCSWSFVWLLREATGKMSWLCHLEAA